MGNVPAKVFYSRKISFGASVTTSRVIDLICEFFENIFGEAVFEVIEEGFLEIIIVCDYLRFVLKIDRREVSTVVNCYDVLLLLWNFLKTIAMLLTWNIVFFFCRLIFRRRCPTSS